jgi:hypothetical protein
MKFIRWTVLMCSMLCIHSWAYANCVGGLEGQLIEIKVRSCENINGETNREVQEHAGQMQDTWDLKKAYTGALVTDEYGSRWMYTASTANPCEGFPNGQVVQKKGYSSCCDTGQWGKCVFGGRWLSDVDGKSINAFQ